MNSGDIAPGLGGVILDNLTVQSALRILGDDEAVQRPRAARRRGDKWDYDLNLALRVAIDVECLAQLVHAIVMHEEIDLSPSFAPDTSGSSGLGDIVRTIDCADVVQRELLLQSAERALDISRLPEFRRYLHALSSGGFVGVILDVSNGYFETGYSDPAALAPFELTEEKYEDGLYLSLARDEAREAAALLDRAKSTTDESEMRQYLTRSASHYHVADRFLDVVDKMRSIDYRDHAFVDVPIPRGYDHEKMTAAYDLVRNTGAALYFQQLADVSGVPYMPHALRAPLAVFDPERTEAPGLEERVLAHVQALRRNRVSTIADTVGDPGFDLDVPLVLARVLRDARTPADVIPRALELRESLSARRLRSWFRDLHILMRTSEADIRSVQRELAGFRALLSRWADAPADAAGPTITVGVTLGVVNLLSGPLPVSPSKIRRRWRLRFLYDLARAGDATPQLGPILAGALGEPTAALWQRAQHVIEQFTRTDGSTGGRDTLLDLRG